MPTYTNAIANIDTLSALALLGFNGEQQGSYIYFPCPECQGRAVAKAWGDKKNLTFCTKCKKSGHIISLAMDVKKIDYKDAVLLLNKVYIKKKPIEEEISLKYDLKYTKQLEEAGISEETAQKLQIGQPTGKTMLSGSIAFTVYNGGKRIAYFGLSKGKPKFHSSFNQELYIYRIDEVQGLAEITLTDSMIECVKLWQDGTPAVCNFELPYLSVEQSELLKEKKVLLKISEQNKKEFSILSVDWGFFHKFV